MNWQWIIVGVLVLVAAWYAGKSFFAQFFHAEDESAGCSACQRDSAKSNPLRVRLIKSSRDEAPRG